MNMKQIRNALPRAIQIHGGGTKTHDIGPRPAKMIVGPEVHEGRHFKSLVKKGMIVVMKEWDLPVPAPFTSPTTEEATTSIDPPIAEALEAAAAEEMVSDVSGGSNGTSSWKTRRRKVNVGTEDKSSAHEKANGE